jgi:hypothetical protein
MIYASSGAVETQLIDCETQGLFGTTGGRSSAPFRTAVRRLRVHSGFEATAVARWSRLTTSVRGREEEAVARGSFAYYRYVGERYSYYRSPGRLTRPLVAR